MKDLIRKTPEFKDLRAQAREAIAAYEDSADFDFTIARLAAIGEKMEATGSDMVTTVNYHTSGSL